MSEPSRRAGGVSPLLHISAGGRGEQQGADAPRSPGKPRRFLLALVAVLVAAATAPAASYGLIDVTVEGEPKGNATHGYAEVWVRVVNRSPSDAHTVRLTFPKSSYSTRGDYLRAVTRTVTVEPGKTARVALAFPERLEVTGSGLAVAIDGSEQDEAVPLGGGSSRYGSRGGMYGPGYGSSSSGPSPLVLYSRAVDTRFPDWVNQAHTQLRFAGRGGFGGDVPLPVPEWVTVPPADVSCVRAEQPVGGWSPNWLGYTRYDGVVVTAAELTTAPGEVRAALAQYVECGGSLLVLGGGKGAVPGPWKPDPTSTPEFATYAAGFGQCLVTNQTDLSDWGAFGGPALGRMAVVLHSWSRTLAPWQRDASPVEANRRFPVVDDLGVPVKGLLALMFLFALVIGPVNLYVLTRKKRKLWLFWTVPAVSLVTCLMVFGYMAIAEGWQGKARAEGLTLLDEGTRRASTIGWTGFYTPLVPGGGLRFGPDTELAFQNGQDPGRYSYRRRVGSPLTIDWTGEQHLASGWLTPRVPAHFVVRKGELRRERVTITRGADGRPEALNSLGADLTDLWYCDETGKLFAAQNVPAGGKAALTPASRPTPPAGKKTLRDVYAGDWATVVDDMKTHGPALLGPRQYLGILDGAPFLDEGLGSGAARKARSAVLGTLREGGDGG